MGNRTSGLATHHRRNVAPPGVVIAIATICVAAGGLFAGEWSMWGGNPSRNMVYTGQSMIPDDIAAGKFVGSSDDIDRTTTRGVKWIAKLGSQTYGNVVVAAGRVLVGTNNESPRDARVKGDRGVLMCLDERTGEMLWQLTVPKLGSGKVGDWEFLGICSSPAVIRDGDALRAYVVTNRGQVVCLDMRGMTDGNDGPFKDEVAFITGDPKSDYELTPRDADIIWSYDMPGELGVFPHNISSNSPLVVDGRVYVATSNGVDWSHKNIPNPRAPSLICLDMRTGELLGEEQAGIGERMFHSNWSNPAMLEVDGKKTIIFGAGDGFCYGFDPVPVKDTDGYGVLRELWRFDCNRPELRTRDGKPIRYATFDGPSEIIATPVAHNGRVYVTIGQDPEHGDGLGQFNCFQPIGSGDITQSARLWIHPIQRSISTPAIFGGLCFISDYAGKLYCFDAGNGQLYWQHNTLSHIWGSPLVVDGKVYIGNEDGYLTILEASTDKKVIAEVPFDVAIYSTPVVANGVLYVATQTHLYAFEAAGE